MSDTPHMQVRDPIGRVSFNGFAQHGEVMVFGLVIEQNPRGIANKAPGPAGDQRRAHNTHGRVQPTRAHILACQQGHNRQQRGQRIRQYMQVGGAQVVIVPVVRVPLIISVIVIVIMVSVVSMIVLMRSRHQHPGTDNIHQQANDGHHQCLVKGNGQGVDQAICTLDSHDQGKTHQHHRAGKPGQTVNLADPKGKAPISGESPRHHIGEYRNPQRGGMGGHVQAVCQQCHGAIHHPSGYFHDHHRSRQNYDDYSATLTRTLFVLAKDVVMRPVAQWLRMHTSFTPSKLIAETAKKGALAIICFWCV